MPWGDALGTSWELLPSPEPEMVIGLQGNTIPVPSCCRGMLWCLASSAALGKGDVHTQTARHPARGMQEISWGKGMSFGAQGLQSWSNANLKMEMVKWEGAVGVGFSLGGGAWHRGCCSRMGHGGFQGRGSQEMRRADSLGTPSNPAGLCLPRHMPAPALVCGDEASWGGHASLSDTLEHQPTQGPDNYRVCVAA